MIQRDISWYQHHIKLCYASIDGKIETIRRMDREIKNLRKMRQKRVECPKCGREGKPLLIGDMMLISHGPSPGNRDTACYIGEIYGKS